MIQPLDWMSAREAAEALDVKPATLYAYVSRGMLHSEPSPTGRAKRYRREDVERLVARKGSRTGAAAAIHGALHWGAPLIETGVSTIDARGPIYRGRAAVQLAATDTSFESVARWLWTGAETPADEEPFLAETDLAVLSSALRAALPRSAPSIDVLSTAVPLLAARAREQLAGTDDSRIAAAGRLVRELAAVHGSVSSPERVLHATAAPTVASSFAAAIGRIDPPSVTAVNRALVLSADHELNASTFAARVAASTGADLHASVGAALATLSGPLHGGACDRIAALVDEAGAPERAVAMLSARRRRGDPVPGFEHRLYPNGDPRTPILLASAEELAPDDRRVRTVFALTQAVDRSGAGHATFDTGLVALAAALEQDDDAPTPGGLALALFAVGRTAGWIAHALEQTRDGRLIRPRARYVPGSGQ